MATATRRFRRDAAVGSTHDWTTAMTPATRDECKYIIERLTEQDDLSETEQQMFDIACEVYEGYAAASELDTITIEEN